MSPWNPRKYLQFENERTRPAAELLARVPVAAPSVVYDLGCGPGNSTRLLRDRWPDAHIAGIDNSPAMLMSARASGVAAEWEAGDVGAWHPRHTPDVIYSNATLQWLPDHARLLPRLMGDVAPGGALAVQMPRNFDAASHTLIMRVVENGPWSERLSGLRDFDPVGAPEAYYELLAGEAAILDIWETIYLHVLNGDDAVYSWITGTALSPYLAALEGEVRERFIGEVKAGLVTAYPRRPDGVTLYPFRRLFIVATRKG